MDTGLIYILPIFLFLIFWIWALLDLANARFKDVKWKLAWLLIIIFFPLLGSILYLLLKKNFKQSRRRSFAPEFRPRRE
ncbi:PLDc N-terminal domain-containing protein [Salinimicrobium oceani]|uniref:Phospholipase n=1 Tax=Salinimicrobium oceani TaxID=2722702 RepID=A0ABX1D2U9_9FLAO|nr:phospholipase [Salinimicrobium oceani]